MPFISGNAMTVAIALVAIGCLLKLHASHADAKTLSWILGPTAALAELVAGSPFTFEHRLGFVNAELNVVITKACSGVNFLVAALSVLGLRLVTIRRWTLEVAGLAALAIVVALGTTVGVNAVRVLWVADIGAQHRVQGTTLYVSALLLLHLGAQHVTRRLR
jgi:exosortase K